MPLPTLKTDVREVHTRGCTRLRVGGTRSEDEYVQVRHVCMALHVKKKTLFALIGRIQKAEEKACLAHARSLEAASPIGTVTGPQTGDRDRRTTLRRRNSR